PAIGVLVVLVVSGVFGPRDTKEQTSQPVGVAEQKGDGKPAQEGVKPDGKGLDLSYIAADFNAAAVLHPRRILKSPLARAVPDAILDEMVRESGIDPRKVEQAIV